MRIASVYTGGAEKACILEGGSLFTVESISRRTGRDWPAGLQEILEGDLFGDVAGWYAGEGGLPSGLESDLSADGALFVPPYRRPGKIWGIGLNYREHADELCEKCPEGEPGSFMKPFTTVIGHGDTIQIPPQSEKTTAEAELGVIIGRKCIDIEEADWLDDVAGFTTVLDMTAEDILLRNVRYLTRCKSFDTFFSFGPVIVTPDEIDDIEALEVSTVLNGEIRARNTVSNMSFKPAALVAVHSQSTTLLPGDIISTGTPGAVVISGGDVAECRITGFPSLVCDVAAQGR